MAALRSLDPEDDPVADEIIQIRRDLDRLRSMQPITPEAAARLPERVAALERHLARLKALAA